MVIKDHNKFTQTKERADAIAIVEAGFAAICVDRIIDSALKLKDEWLTIADKSYNLADYDRLLVVGIGKGSAVAAKALERLLGERIDSGHVIDVQTLDYDKLEGHIGTHPLPSNQNIDATDRVVDLLETATERDLILGIICGGGSALLCKPGGLSCLELQFISHVLLMKGASIQEINTVRKHVSRVHGGFFAVYAYPATLHALIISDVPGDDISVIASGPTVLDPSSRAEAEAIVKKYKIPEFELLETPKDPQKFSKVTNTLVGSGKLAVDAMAQKATELGYLTRVWTNQLDGVAREVGVELAQSVQPGEVLLAAGETRVVVEHPGRGGRNQEVALSALSVMPDDVVVVSVNSDGKDNEPVAGALVDGRVSRQRLNELAEHIETYLDQNNSFELLEKLDALIEIEPITANVSDFMLALRPKSDQETGY